MQCIICGTACIRKRTVLAGVAKSPVNCARKAGLTLNANRSCDFRMPTWKNQGLLRSTLYVDFAQATRQISSLIFPR